MTFSIETWHVVLALVTGLAWIYVQFLRPTQAWRAEADKQIALLQQRSSDQDARLQRGDDAFDRLEAAMREHEGRQQQRNEKVLQRLAAIETLLRERGGVPPD